MHKKQHMFIFKWSFAGLKLVFTFTKSSCLSKLNEPSQLNDQSSVGVKIVRFIPFLRVIALFEMKKASSKN